MWDWAIWAALGVGAVMGIAALGLLVLRALAAWRDFRDTRGAVLGGLDEFTSKAEAVADRLAVGADTVEVQESLRRLRLSLARLAVLRAALDEVNETVGLAMAVVPRK
jgi:hypothetical protein